MRSNQSIGDLVERLIRIKDGMTHRADRDSISEACNFLTRLHKIEKAAKDMAVALEPFSQAWADAIDGEKPRTLSYFGAVAKLYTPVTAYTAARAALAAFNAT